MFKITIGKALFSACLSTAAFTPIAGHTQAATANVQTALDKNDQAILAGMARANLAEIEAGKLALTNAEDATVKAYAQQMIDDHTKALNDVTVVAQKKGIALPADLDAKHKAMAVKLSKLKGKSFDKTYMAQAGVQDHKQVHAKLKKDEANAKDPDIKALASQMLPTVEQHLQSATKHQH